MTSMRSPSHRNSTVPWPPGEGWNKPFLRFGHGGAGAHAPANTLRSLALALEMGVDVVEFDVRPCRDGLVLLHDDSLAEFGAGQRLASESTLAELHSLPTGPDRAIPTFGDALDLLRGRALLNVDLKATGYEEAVLEQVAAKGMAGDVLYSSLYPGSLRRIRDLDRQARIGISYPEDRRNAMANPRLAPLIPVAIALLRLALPFRILRMMAGAGANAVMLNHRVVSRRAVRTVQGAGGRVFTWTVDTPERMREVAALGVNGITTNRPDLFAGFGS